MQVNHRIPTNEGGRLTIFHFVIIGLSLALTLGAWQFSQLQVDKRINLRFESAVDQALGLITDRMARYEDALWAGVAAVESHGGDMTLAEWRTFSRNLDIGQRYPGINGIGVIHYLTPLAREDYLARHRAERPEFRIFPEHDQPFFMPITYIEPEDINAAAVGLDVAHEINRRTAALASRDSGLARITGPIVLVQDTGKTSGFLFYAPFYAGGPPSSASERGENFLGAVYAPFVVHKLMEGLLAKELRNLRFSIRDGSEMIYDEHGNPEDEMIDSEPMLARQVTLDLYGRSWTLDVRTDLGFRAENTNSKPTVILFAGLLIETLIISFLFFMSRANARAIAYADRVTEALKEEKTKLVTANAELSAKNEDLERFAYVASHDLKTPIRGIGGLTEMVQEDLADYFDSPDADPEVSRNLERIHDRVRRMEDLTNGIMTLSLVDAGIVESPPVALADIVSGLLVDFDLASDRVTLSGGDEMIGHDIVNLRSVLENLVGNAIKYHDGQRTLALEIAAVRRGDRIEISVADNGPGIDPRFHDRIFELFQTLALETGTESTGIGLSIVRKAVERHGGRIGIRSEPGQGACFTFDWPRHTATADQDMETAA